MEFQWGAEMRDQIPVRIESEKAALGAALLSETDLTELLAHVRIEDFSLSSHREILRAAQTLKTQGKAADCVSVSEELQRLGKLEETGGAAYLGELMDAVPHRPRVEAYARNIRESARMRALHSAFEMAHASIEGGEDIEQVLARLDETRTGLANINPNGGRELFVSAPRFVAQAPERIDWLVEGVIERGANGFFSAVPKGGKSWAAIDLAISLALGCDWLGFRIPQAVKVALISREDNPALTAWRIRNLAAGKSCAVPALLELNLFVNSRRESPELLLDNREQMAELMAALRTLRPRFAIFDVFNVLHVADENDNQEMRHVLRQLSTIQAEIGCGIGVIHHYNKSDQGSMTQRLRGSSAIAGWAEWLVGISLADEETKTRRMEFELKAAQPPDPRFYRINSTDEWTQLEPVEFHPRTSREGEAAARLMR